MRKLIADFGLFRVRSFSADEPFGTVSGEKMFRLKEAKGTDIANQVVSSPAPLPVLVECITLPLRALGAKHAHLLFYAYTVACGYQRREH